ncbi:MAG: LytTR family transcriptional regulator [Ruminococcaceae bacterium]|nr:LytTR family transcriptional regulator [Oscillospiraceae bacterium]
MKIKIVIDKDRDEEVLIIAKERTELVDKIERLVKGDESIVAKRDRVSYNIELSEVVCFTSDDNKVFVHAGKDILEVDEKLYELEVSLPDNFIKINKSCIANIEKIKSFDATISGTLAVSFKNGYRDYVSRRRLKYVKERLMKK